VGLRTVDVTDGSSQLEFPVAGALDQHGNPVGDNWEGLAWSPAGTVLYGTDGVRLYRFDPVLGDVDLVCSNLGSPGTEVEALEFAPDGTLVGGVHLDPAAELIAIGFPLDAAAFGPNACTVGAIPLPGGDVAMDDIEWVAFACDVIQQPGSCADGKPKALTFRYTGSSCAATTNFQNGKFLCSGDPAGAQPVQVVLTADLSAATISPITETIPVGGEFTVTATGTNLKANTYFAIKKGGSVLQSLAIHTSCSQQLEVGDVFGSLVLTGFVPAD
jgi:hypothetical protein